MVRLLVQDLVKSFLLGFSEPARRPRFFFNGDGHFVIVTREPEDPSRSSNGGDYRFWRQYSPRRGKAQDFSSCDFWQPESHTLRFRPMSRSRFMQHVRPARRLAERLHRRGVRLDAWRRLPVQLFSA